MATSSTPVPSLTELKALFGDALPARFPKFLHPYVPVQDRKVFVSDTYMHMQRTLGATFVDPIEVTLTTLRNSFPNASFAYITQDSLLRPQIRFTVEGTPFYFSLPDSPDSLEHSYKHALLTCLNHLPLLQALHKHHCTQLKRNDITIMIGGGFQLQAFFSINYERYISILGLKCEDAYGADYTILPQFKKFKPTLCSQHKEYNSLVASATVHKVGKQLCTSSF